MLDWLLTYALHSTAAALCALALVAGLRRLGVSPAVRVVALRTALLGPLLTASFAVWSPVEGLGSRNLDWAPPAAPVIALPEVGALPERELASLAPATDDAAAAVPADEQEEAAAGAVRRLGWGLPFNALPWIFGALGLIATLRVALCARTAQQRLAGRRTGADEAVAARATELRGSAVHVSECRGLATPLALGRREVVLPDGALEGLSASERDALLAHEVAHLARRDPLWSGVARIVAALTAAQPLQHLLMNQLDDDTELAADAWAVSRTKRPLELARCLERMGARLRSGNGASVAVPLGGVAMARRASALVRRVEELCTSETIAAAPRTGAASAMCLGLVVLAACGAPAVRGNEEGTEEVSDAAATLGGDEAFEMFRAVMTGSATGFDFLRGGDFAGQAIETEAGALDFSPHGWDNRAPELHFAAAETPAGETRVRSFGHDLAGVPAVETFLRRLYAERSDIAISFDADEDVPMETVTELVDAAIQAGFTDITFRGSNGREVPEDFFLTPLDEEEEPILRDVAIMDPVEEEPGDLRGSVGAEDFFLGGPRDAQEPVVDQVGPFAVTKYAGPDAEDGERRFTMRLRSSGGVERLPTDGLVTSGWVLDHLRNGMRRGPLGDTGLTALQDRIVLEGHADTAFGFALAWFGNFARQNVLLYKTELALIGEEPVSVFLPHDLEVVPEEIEEGSDVEVPEGPTTVLVTRSGEDALYAVGPRRVTDIAAAVKNAKSVAQYARPRNYVVVDARQKTTFGDVVPLVRALRAEGLVVAFTGSFAPPNLEKSLRKDDE